MNSYTFKNNFEKVLKSIIKVIYNKLKWKIGGLYGKYIGFNKNFKNIKK